MMSKRASRSMLVTLGLALVAGPPMSAWAADCPKGGCKPSAPPARPAAPPPRSGAGAPTARPAFIPPQQSRPGMGGQGAGPMVDRQAGRPGAAGSPIYQSGVHQPGAYPSGVHQSGARLGGQPGRGGAYSPNRTFSFHGRSFAAVRARPYRYPRGYGYRPYYAGQRFPAFLLLTPYFITNYALYNLSAPPDPSLVWVRYGPDALLVNTYTGEVVDTAPGVFDEDPGDDGGGYAQAPDGSGYGPPPPPPPGYGGPPPGPQDGDNTAYPGPTGYPEPPPGGPQP